MLRHSNRIAVRNCAILLKQMSKISSSSIPPPHPQISTTATTQSNSTSSTATKPINKNLPKQPLPSIRSSVLKFIKFARPLQNDVEYEQTISVANSFLHSREAETLQTYLEERHRKLPNWMTPWWIDKAYLESRTPLPVFSNPAVAFPKFNYNGVEGQIDTAAKIAQSALQFYNHILKNELAEEKAGDVSLDMSQYKYLFGTTRIPILAKDQLKYAHQFQTPPKHFIAMHNGHMFRVPAFDSDGSLLSIEQLKNELKRNVMALSKSINEHPIGVMTAENRNKWAQLYAKLKGTSGASIGCIEEALFILCIDNPIHDINDALSAKDVQSLQCLHGGGCENNSHNRWFDKTLQFIIGTDGYCGVNYEHSSIEGSPVAALMEYICDKFDRNNFETQNAQGDILSSSKLDFKLNEQDCEVIENAEANINELVADTELLVYTFKEYGRELIKELHLSPDSYIQMAMQLAYYRIHHKNAITYESASLRRFLHGRTDTIRLPSIESAIFNHEFMDQLERKPSKTQLVHMLRFAIQQHRRYALQAINGDGMDRHLLGLKLAANELEVAQPEIFDTKVYKEMMNFKLSTSQLPTKHLITMCYGPSSMDCYAVCYNPQQKQIHFSICTFKRCYDTSSYRFAKELQQSLIDMEDLLKDHAHSYRSKL